MLQCLIQLLAAHAKCDIRPVNLDRFEQKPDECGGDGGGVVYQKLHPAVLRKLLFELILYLVAVTDLNDITVYLQKPVSSLYA